MGVVEPVLDMAPEPLECEMHTEAGLEWDWRLSVDEDRPDHRFNHGWVVVGVHWAALVAVAVAVAVAAWFIGVYSSASDSGVVEGSAGSKWLSAVRDGDFSRRGCCSMVDAGLSGSGCLSTMACETLSGSVFRFMMDLGRSGFVRACLGRVVSVEEARRA